MSFTIYDKDGTARKIIHEIDYRSHIKSGFFTAEPPGKKKEVDGKPASKKEIKAIVKLAGDKINFLVEHLEIESIDSLTKDDIQKAEAFINQD